MIMKEVRCVQGGDGYWYVIPAERADEFSDDLERPEVDCDYFDRVWGPYAVGVCLSNVKLYR